MGDTSLQGMAASAVACRLQECYPSTWTIVLPISPDCTRAAPNNSLKLTRLAGENALVPGQPRYARMCRAMPEPPGSIARAVGPLSLSCNAEDA